jgi:SAM-dependent methyltransferase
VVSGSTKTVPELMQRQANDRVWQTRVRVRGYANRQLRPVEVVILARYGHALAGRVLELGSGAGRLTGYLVEIATSVHGVDLSPAMIEYARERYPGATFTEGDMRDLTRFGSARWEAVVAGFNVIDILDDADRNRLLDEVHRLLVPGGMVILSSHNRDVVDRLGAPQQLRGWPSRGTIGMLVRLPIWYRNRRRLLRFERDEAGYAIRNDVAHDFGVLHYYVSRDAQQAQFERHGFELLACLDEEGREVRPGQRSESHELHYVARRSG